MQKRYLDVRKNNRGYTVSLESLVDMVFFRFSLLFVCLFVGVRERRIVRLIVDASS